MFLRRSLASLARAYKLQIFSVGIFGGLPPPPPPNTMLATLVLPFPATEVITFILFIYFWLACQFVPPENEGTFLGEDFFLGGGGGGGLSPQNFSAPLRKNPSYATAWDPQGALPY